MADNFGAAFLQGQESAQTQQMNTLIMQGEKQKLQQTALLLKQQEGYMRELARLNGHASTPGSTPPTPQAQARQHADMLFRMADAAASQGMTEEARKNLEEGGKLSQNAAMIDYRMATVQKDKATSAASLMEYALEAKDDPREFQKRVQNALMVHQMNWNEKSPWADKQVTPEIASAIAAAAHNKVQEAEIALKKAQEDHASAGAALERAGIPLRAAQTRAASELAEKRKREGDVPKVSAKDKKQAETLDDVINDVDDLIAQLDAHPDMSMTGLAGRAHSLGETISGLAGGTGAGPEHQFQSSIAAIQTKLPRAMTGASRSSKEERELTKTLADLMQPGLTGTLGRQKAQKLKELLQAQRDKSPVKQDKSPASYSSADAVREAFAAGEIEKDEAIEILKSQFGMGD